MHASGVEVQAVPIATSTIIICIKYAIQLEIAIRPTIHYKNGKTDKKGKAPT